MLWALMRHIMQPFVLRHITYGLVFLSIPTYAVQVDSWNSCMLQSLGLGKMSQLSQWRCKRTMLPEKTSHSFCMSTGAVGTRSKSGHLLLRYHIWQFHQPLSNGQKQAECQCCDPIFFHTFNDYFHRMFLNKCYAQASVAFLRAGGKQEATICDAYLLQEKARSTSTMYNATRTQAFITALDTFITYIQNCPSKQESSLFLNTLLILSDSVYGCQVSTKI